MKSFYVVESESGAGFFALFWFINSNLDESLSPVWLCKLEGPARAPLILPRLLLDDIIWDIRALIRSIRGEPDRDCVLLLQSGGPYLPQRRGVALLRSESSHDIFAVITELLWFTAKRRDAEMFGRVNELLRTGQWDSDEPGKSDY